MSKILRNLRNAAASAIVGASALAGNCDNAKGAAMSISTVPQQTEIIRGGSFQVNINVDTTSLPSSVKINSGQFYFDVPTGMASYLTPTQNGSYYGFLPSSNDFFAGKTMNSSLNYVGKTQAAGEWDNNRKVNSSSDGVIQKAGEFGHDNFATSSSMPVGNYNFTLRSVYFYDTNANPYKLTSGNLIITNNSFTILNHSQGSLDALTQTSSKNVSMNLLKGANASSNVIFTNLSGSYIAGADINSASASGAVQLSSTSGVTNLASGSSKTYTALIDTSSVGNKSGSVVINAGDTNLPGKGAASNFTTNYNINVGNAVADRSNSASSFGSSLIAELSAGQSYSGLESYVLSSTGVGGASALGSKATILSGTASNATTVSEKWRTRTQDEALTTPGSSVMPKDAYNLVSDVVNISGVPDQFTLNMAYAPSQLVFKGGNTESSLADKGAIYIATRDSNGNWVRTGKNQVVDTVNHTVTATLDHNSDFAVVPEPGTGALIILGGLGLLARRRRVPFTKEEIRQDFANRLR